MKRAIRLLAIASAATALGGCQSFPLTSWMFKDKPAAGQREALAGNTAGALEEGRAHLRDGNISAAVASFRIAQLDRATRADASNGLGVAYARLGRADLAERYFQAAMLAEPENPKFIANLLRLQQQVMLASGPRAQTPVAAAVPQRAPQPQLASQQALTGPAERASRAEVLVRSRPDAASAPAMAIIYRDAPESVEPMERRADEEQLARAAPASALPMTVVFGE